ncbi:MULTISPECIES: hypothetical protein [Lysinibacillus]|uniref:hypothetical protein n=1 Tax=Lysinibacillus TaxID=400634 RepID=UPI00083C9954|nr:hypothetical protein [Lysinibacillus xylanilyticus]
MLELTSAVWGNLTEPKGSGENVPALLQELKQAYDQETVDALFEDYLFIKIPFRSRYLVYLLWK